MTRPAAPGPERHEVRIGLWGSTGSGKTTYLGALKLAAEQTNRSDVSWTVVGADDVSTAALAEYAGILANERRFPTATFANVPLRWNLLGARHNSLTTNRSASQQRRPAGRAAQVEFAVELMDLSGQLLDDKTWLDPSALAEPEEEVDDLDFDIPDPSEPRGPEADMEQVLKHLTDCHGILYLFDPIRDEADGDAYRYFNTMMSQIEARALRAGRMLGPKLPHHFAFCITKFDDREVLSKALGEKELANLQGNPPPIKIDTGVATRYLDTLARERPHGTARLVRDAVRAHVLPDRVKYYAMSSVGFWWGPDERFDQYDFGNVLENGGAPTIRGSIRPMNVLEPLIWLVSHIRKAQQDGLQT